MFVGFFCRKPHRGGNVKSATTAGRWRSYAAFGLLALIIETLAMMAERTAARAGLAIVVLDVVPFCALSVIVVHSFPGTG